MKTVPVITSPNLLGEAFYFMDGLLRRFTPRNKNRLLLFTDN